LKAFVFIWVGKKLSLIINRDCVLQEAKTWVGTPWVAQARVKGIGVDCINFLAACGDVAGIHVDIPLCYKRRPVNNSLHNYLTANFSITQNPQPADLIAFSYRNLVAHVGLYLGDNTFIHAYCASNPSLRCVRVDRLDEFPFSWRNRIAYFLDAESL
jgi:cell wall-associated NlpC family hydrolase